MKWSFYNLTFEFDGRHVIFNTFSGSILEVSAEMIAAMTAEGLQQIDPETKNTLADLGFLVAESENELQKYLGVYEQAKERGGSLCLKVFMATNCNLGCPYCYQDAPAKSKEVVSGEMLNRLTKWISSELESGTDKIQLEFYGGEPLLARTQLTSFIESLSSQAIEAKKRIDYSIVTNGTLLTRPLVELFSKYNVHMQITVDGGKKTHDARRFFKTSGRGSFDIITQKLRLIKDAGAAHLIRLRMNVDAENVAEVEEVASLARKLGVSDFKVGRIHFREKSVDYDPMIVPDEGSYEQSVELSIFRVLVKYGYSDSPVDLELKTTCLYHKERGFAVSPSMHLFKCDELIDYPEFSVGAIDESGDLRLNEAALTMAVDRNPTDFEHCGTCRFLPQCGSGCSIRALNVKGSPHLNFCEATYSSVKRKVGIYLQAEHEGIIPEDGIEPVSQCHCS